MAFLAGTLLLLWVSSLIHADLVGIILPSAVTLCLVCSFRITYPWARLKVNEKRRVASDPVPPHHDASATADFPEATGLWAQQIEFHRLAVQAQGEYFLDGNFAAFLSPAALFLLSGQILLFPGGGPWAAGFALAGGMCLALLIFFAWRSVRPSETWIVNRTKAELFRRELGLRVFGLGPYLDLAPADSTLKELNRSAEIRAAQAVEELLRLLPMADDGRPWLEAIFDSARPATITSDYLGRMRSYAQHRVRRQLVWFRRDAEQMRREDDRWSKPLLMSAILATILAWGDFLRLLLEPPGGPSLRFVIAARVLGISSIVLPPLSVAIQGIRNLYGWRSRQILFQRKERFLNQANARVTGLIQRWGSLQGAPNVDWPKERTNFEAFVLWTEQSLTEELEQWILLMERPRLET